MLRKKGFRHRKLVLGITLALVVIGAFVAIAQDQETLRIRTPLAAEDPQFPLYLARLLGRPLMTATERRVLTNGPLAYEAMLSAIDAARERISFETYVFGAGDVPHRFAEAFAAAARRGVTVRLVLDAIGAADMDRDDIALLDDAGVRIGWFNALGPYSLEEVNYRTHRKILVVDGVRAFVGGIGVADQWLTQTEFPAWRDTQVQLDGPVAAAIEGGFSENWIETGGIVDPVVDPAPAGTGAPREAIVEWSSPEGGANGMKLLYLLAIGAARRQLDIQSPYLIVDESSLWSLQEARHRGVRVRLLVEGDRTDAMPVKYASRADYERLLELGIEIAEYQPTMMHTKATIVDGVMSIVGSANFDNRSLELNDELNVAVFDPGTAARLTRDFDHDWAQSKVLYLDKWRHRSLHTKALGWMWSVFGEVF